jgi:hypothetical protein
VNLSLTQDVAALFHVRPKAVYKWRREPDCPLRGFRVGNRRFFTEAELTAFAEWRRPKEYAAS